MIKVIYNKTCGRCVQSEPLTSGMVGQPIHFEYSHDFDGLSVTAVFTDGKNTVDVVNPGNECVIPHEVLTTVGATVKVGIYAVKGDELVIPTIYATIGAVLKGADPSGDVSADPTLPVWAQIQGIIGNLNDLSTEAKNNLVAAINEAAQSGGGGGSTSIAMRVDGGYIQYSTDKGKTWVNLIAEADLKGDKGDKGADGVNGKDGTPGVYYGTTQPTGDTHPVWIDPDGGHDDGGLLPAVTAADNGKVLRVVNSAWSADVMPTGGTDMGITGATVGQIAKITAVDDTGKPTAWEAVDMPSGGGGSGETWEAINAITLSDAVNTVTINTDSGGNAIALKKVRILVEGSATHNQDLFLNNSRYIRATAVGTAASVGALSAEPFCGKMYCFAVTNIFTNYGFSNQTANVFSGEITITEIKLIVNNSGTFSAGTKFTIQGVRA